MAHALFFNNLMFANSGQLYANSPLEKSHIDEISMTTNKPHMARLILMTDFSESYANKLLQGIMRYSHEHTPWIVCKMPLTLRDTGRMDEVIDFAQKWSADAIIGQFDPEDDLSIFREKGIIAIAQDYKTGFDGVCNIRGDYDLCGRICAQYFISKGARNFAFYGRSGVIWSDGRREGFVSEISERVEGNTISIYERVSTNAAWWYDLSSLTHWLESLPKPVAIMACDDNMAYQIVEACQTLPDDRLRIPEDIMLLGVDNDEALCELCYPQLSSLIQDVTQAGYETAQMIDEQLSRPLSERFEGIHDIHVLPTYVVTRRSTSAYICDNPYISRALSYIHDHLCDHLNVDDIVAQLPMSRRLLEKTFRREMGISIYQFIIQARVNKMKELIRSGKTLKETADELGVDYKIIARNFKNATGVYPSEFEKMQSLDK